MPTIRAISILGPTGSGKSALALAIASQFPQTVIVNADSQQVYRGMVIGTGAPSLAERGQVPHYLYQHVAPDRPYDLGHYLRDVDALLSTLGDAIPIFVGGAGFYMRGLWQGLPDLPSDREIRKTLHAEWCDDAEGLYAELLRADPVAAKTIHPRNRVRLLRALEVIRLTGQPFSAFKERRRPIPSLAACHWLKLGIAIDRKTLYERINARVEAMCQAGLREELEKLLGECGECWALTRSLGYKEFLPVLLGTASVLDCKQHLKQSTRRYAKRQLTWFRNDEDSLWKASEELLARAGEWLRTVESS